MPIPATDPRYLRVQHLVARDLRRRYRKQLARLTAAEERAYLEAESHAYAAAYMAVAHPA